MTSRDLDRMFEPEGRDSAGELSPALCGAIANRMAENLAPVRPLPSAGRLTAGFALAFLASVLAGGVLLRPVALAKMDWLTACLVFVSLGVCAGLLAATLAAQMAPGSRQVAPAWMLAPGIVLALGIAFAAIFPSHEEPDFGLRAVSCLRTGLAAGALSAALLWLILRRGAVLDARWCGALAGLLGGLAGTTILESHCPDFNAAHILAGHWGAALLCAGLGWGAGAIAARREARQNSMRTFI
jgi:hypothetical protein